MKINYQKGFTEFSAEIEEVNQIKEDIKVHLDPIIALVLWINRVGNHTDTESIPLMWSFVQTLHKEYLNEN